MTIMRRIVANVLHTCGHWTHVFGVWPEWVAWLQAGPCASCDLQAEIRPRR